MENNIKCVEICHVIPKVGKFEKISYSEFEKTIPNSSNEFDKITLPKRADVGSAGYDFFTPLDVELNPQEEVLIPTGIKCKMNYNWVLMVFPRSSLGFKYYTRLANSVGIIDASYYGNETNEGHIMIKIRNEGTKKMTLKQGDRFCQGIFLPFGITEDDETDGVRIGGFGSSGR